jgi:hypothetical protein
MCRHHSFERGTLKKKFFASGRTWCTETWESVTSQYIQTQSPSSADHQVGYSAGFGVRFFTGSVGYESVSLCIRHEFLLTEALIFFLLCITGTKAENRVCRMPIVEVSDEVIITTRPSRPGTLGLEHVIDTTESGFLCSFQGVRHVHLTLCDSDYYAQNSRSGSLPRMNDSLIV